MKRVLVTGAGGFIGSAVVKKLELNNYIVEEWDRFEGPSLKGIDMNDSERIIEGLNAFRPDIVIHCAGCADVGNSIKNPDADFIGNVGITHNLLFAMHKAQLDKTRFVFLSSAGVYGNPVSLPITEDMKLNPLSPYAVHKVMCEDLCCYFMNNYGMDVKIARIFSAYGKGLRKQIFWDMYNKSVKTGKLEMFGTGNESRDYIHVNDVVQSIYLLAVSDTSDVIFNVANGEEITIRKATEYFADSMGIDDIQFNGVVREGDPLNWRADISKMRSIGYEKTVEMGQGISDYVDWVESL